MTVTLTTLDSGLRVITDRIDSVETVSCGAWFGIGTRHEIKEMCGISHMLEHMAFKGTNRRTALQIAEEIESVGGYLNAYTARDVTAYYARCLKEDLSLSVDILADILQHSTFDATEFERERGVIIQEIGQSNDTPDDVVFDYFQETAYPDQPMGWATLGTEDVIRALSPDNVRDYMHNHYSLSNMVFAAAGNISHDEVVHLASEHFKAMTPNIPLSVKPAKYTGGEFVLEKDLEQAHIILGFEGVPFGHQDYYAMMVYTTMMGGGMSSRLFQEVREKRGLAYTVHASAASYLDSGLFHVYAGTSAEDVATLVPVLCDELSKSRKGFDAAEIHRAKAQLKASLMMGLESTSNRCERLANQMRIYGRALEPADVARSIENVTPQDIARLVDRMLTSPHTLTAYGPVSHLPKTLNFG